MVTGHFKKSEEMKASSNGINLIIKFEGFSPKVYICPAGYATIGYGHLIKDNEPYLAAELTKEEAQKLLGQDLSRFEKGIVTMTSAKLSQNQFDALCSFTFNLGLGAYQRSTLRMKINRGEYFDASLELLKWIRGGGRVLPGLVKRRHAERELFLSTKRN